MVGTGVENTSSLFTLSFRSAPTASLASLTALATIWRPSSSCQTPQVSGYGIGGHVATSAFTTWTTVSGMFLIAASVAPQQAAASDSSEPSTPTTTPCCLRGLDISFSLRLEQRYEPGQSPVMRL